MDNVAIVLDLYERVARGESDSVADLLHRDIEWSMPHPGGEARGVAEVGRFWREFNSAWDNHVMELEEARALDDERVLVLFNERATGRASGIETAASPAVIWTLRDGKIVRMQAWLDRAEALEAAERGR
jgi:ketosteroid isomerase-like protein